MDIFCLSTLFSISSLKSASSMVPTYQLLPAKYACTSASLNRTPRRAYISLIDIFNKLLSKDPTSSAEITLVALSAIKYASGSVGNEPVIIDSSSACPAPESDCSVSKSVAQIGIVAPCPIINMVDIINPTIFFFIFVPHLYIHIFPLQYSCHNCECYHFIWSISFSYTNF